MGQEASKGLRYTPTSIMKPLGGTHCGWALGPIIIVFYYFLVFLHLSLIIQLHSFSYFIILFMGFRVTTWVLGDLIFFLMHYSFTISLLLVTYNIFLYGFILRIKSLLLGVIIAFFAGILSFL